MMVTMTIMIVMTEEKQENEVQWITGYKKSKHYLTFLHQTKFAVFLELFEVDWVYFTSIEYRLEIAENVD